MKDLIEALKIFGKYIDPEDQWPTHCEHDELYVKGPPPGEMEDGDAEKLRLLDFDYVEKANMWRSYRFGSC